jgi:hypothetical protein
MNSALTLLSISRTVWATMTSSLSLKEDYDLLCLLYPYLMALGRIVWEGDFLFYFFLVLGFELGAYTSSHSHLFFVTGFFR